MNPQLMRARIFTLGSFLVNAGCQLYCMRTTPNMKQVADANHYAFSPNPSFIAAFFAMQVVLQLYWIKNLFLVSSDRPSSKYEHRISLPGAISKIDPAILAPPENPKEPEPAQMAYAPIYALGNLCIATWMVFWTKGWFWAAQIMVTINTCIQLYAIYYLLGSSSPFALSKVNISTHLVAKTFAGIGVLDFLDNGAVAARYAGPPSVPVQTLAIVLFFLLALSSDFTFSLCMFYNVMALIVGQPTWRPALGVALALVGLVVFCGVLFVWRKRTGIPASQVGHPLGIEHEVP